MKTILSGRDLTNSCRCGNFPPERLPDWVATIHSVLPIQAMGEVIRGTPAWIVFAVTGRVLTRRG
jgi:hypothetical protein